MKINTRQCNTRDRRVKDLFLPRDRRVKDLFLPHTRAWNEEKVRKIFLPHDANDILGLKPMQHGEDIPAWHFEKSGIFSVRSAYKLA